MAKFNEKKRKRQKVLARWSLGGKYHIAVDKGDGEVYFPCSPQRGWWPLKKIEDCFGIHWNIRPGITKRTKLCRTCLRMPENELAIKMLHDPMFNMEKLLKVIVMPGANMLEIIEHLERHPDVVTDETRIVKK
jgi:hypothetical protein